MPEKIVQINEEVIKGQIKELVRGSVEETLNGDHLINVIRGDTAICGNTQYPVIIDSRA